MALACHAPGAVEFRRSIPIRTPDTFAVEYADEVRRACVPEPCDDLIPLERPVPVRRSTVKDAVELLEESWNTLQLREQLAETFFDKSRLLDTIREVVPRDARLRILSVRNVQVLAQFRQAASSTRPGLLLSVLSARIRTQVQFTDSTQGRVRSRRSNQEYVLVLTEEE